MPQGSKQCRHLYPNYRIWGTNTHLCGLWMWKTPAIYMCQISIFITCQEDYLLRSKNHCLTTYMQVTLWEMQIVEPHYQKPHNSLLHTDREPSVADLIRLPCTFRSVHWWHAMPKGGQCKNTVGHWILSIVCLWTSSLYVFKGLRFIHSRICGTMW